ncbi:MAG: segregation and condensation protein B [Parcubacteria group bacterium Athens0416_74]|nr:MAG: segregation and condensation protein B [Parcubacteria group bacterium Athens0416_74]
MSTPDKSTQLEALLFSEGGPVARKKLAQLMDSSLEDLSLAVDELTRRKAGTGISVIATAQDVALAVAPEAAPIVQAAFERELGKEIGDAGLEVLSIILYRGPSTRAEIDYIRGVNTSWTIRTLAARGLLERAQNPNDAREYLYQPTVELLAHLGVTHARELPDYAKISSELAAFEEKAGPFETNDHASGTTDSTA